MPDRIQYIFNCLFMASMWAIYSNSFLDLAKFLLKYEYFIFYLHMYIFFISFDKVGNRFYRNK